MVSKIMNQTGETINHIISTRIQRLARFLMLSWRFAGLLISIMGLLGVLCICLAGFFLGVRHPFTGVRWASFKRRDVSLLFGDGSPSFGEVCWRGLLALLCIWRRRLTLH